MNKYKTAFVQQADITTYSYKYKYQIAILNKKYNNKTLVCYINVIE